MAKPIVECACGRQLTATTAEPYGVRIGGRQHRYFYVRGHNQPTGERCPADSTTPIPYLDGTLKTVEDNP